MHTTIAPTTPLRFVGMHSQTRDELIDQVQLQAQRAIRSADAARGGLATPLQVLGHIDQLSRATSTLLAYDLAALDQLTAHATNKELVL